MTKQAVRDHWTEVEEPQLFSTFIFVFPSKSWPRVSVQSRRGRTEPFSARRCTSPPRGSARPPATSDCSSTRTSRATSPSTSSARPWPLPPPSWTSLTATSRSVFSQFPSPFLDTASSKKPKRFAFIERSWEQPVPDDSEVSIVLSGCVSPMPLCAPSLWLGASRRWERIQEKCVLLLFKVRDP